MNNNLYIKVATSSDIANIHILAKEIWTQHYTPIIGVPQVSYMLEKIQSQAAIETDILNGYVYYIAYSDGTPCGYSAIKIDNSALFLSKFYVKQNYRKKGVGKSILNYIDTYAKQNCAKRMWLTCNKHNDKSLAVYQKLGFTIIDECITDIGKGFVMDDYVLEKNIV